MGECKEDKGLPLLPLSTFPSTNTQDSPEPEETGREKCKKYIILSSLFMAYLLVSAAYSIIALFYPQEVSNPYPSLCGHLITCIGILCKLHCNDRYVCALY